VLDRVLGAWLHTRAARAGGRLVVAIDGKTVRGAKNKETRWTLSTTPRRPSSPATRTT